MLSPSFESSTLLSAAWQYMNDFVRPACSLSLSVSGIGFIGGGGMFAALLHSSMFDIAMCATRWPKVCCAGVGLQPNFSAGISSTAATKFFCCRSSISFTVSVTGFLLVVVFAGAVLLGSVLVGSGLSCPKIKDGNASTARKMNSRFINVSSLLLGYL